MLELARGIELARRQDAEGEPATLSTSLGLLGAVPLRAAFVAYPQSAERSLALLPGTFCLIVCFLPFVVAAPSLLREREAHTLEILLAAPGIRGGAVFAGKCLAAVGVGLASAVVMLVVLQSAYHVYVKSGALAFFLFLLLPLLSSALLGLAVSALAHTQTQTVMAAAVYFFCLLLLSGFLYPADESSAAIRTISYLFGLTHLLPPAHAWMFGAGITRGLGSASLVLAVQCAAYAAVAWTAWRRLLSRI